MVRKITSETDQKQAYAQWFAAWQLLAVTAQDAIIAFCLGADGDIAEIALWL